MFGFVHGPCSSCSSREYSIWRGVFCGVAKELSGRYGLPAKLLVNRDATLLALLGLSVDARPALWRRTTCCNPLATPYPIAGTHPALEYAAAVSVCGLAAKLEDDADDERGPRRAGSRLGRWLSSSAVDRAIGWLNQRSFPTARVMELLAGQGRLESFDPARADEPTRRSFGLIAGFVAELAGRPDCRPQLVRWGEAHGTLVYWQDAREDQAHDRRRGRFNPLELPGGEALAQARTATAWRDFQDGLTELPALRHQTLLGDIGARTAAHHALTREERRERRRRRREQGGSRHCCDHCDYCCDGCSGCGGATGKSSGCLDTCFDCGPGDTGCIDCCPCDGCDCCPCH